jgi:hypothetical protein
MTDDDPMIHLPMEQSLYELLQLEAERMNCDCFEECIRDICYQHLRRVHQDQLHMWDPAPVGVSDRTARRMQLMADVHRQAGSNKP